MSIPAIFETVLRHRLRLLRLIDNELISSDCEIECEIDVVPQEDHSLIFLHLSAMKLWLEDFVDGAIAYHHDYTSDTQMLWLSMLDNKVIMTPEIPEDHVMLAVIHAKLNTIGGDITKVVRTQFVSDTGHGFCNRLSGSADTWLPSMKDWIGDRHFHKQPWWYRPDASAIDITPDTNDDTVKIPDLGDNLVDMLKFNHTMSAADLSLDDDKSAEGKSAEIIKPKFKPRVITDDDC